MTGSPHLVAAGASWDDGPDAGAWIAARLGPFGASVGHAVPHGYDAYAVVPVPSPADDPQGTEDAAALARLLDVLAEGTGDQPVHCGLWEGWGFLHDHGTDPRDAPGMGTSVVWTGDGPPDAAEMERARAEAREALAARRVERPAAEPLHLPHRAYHLWTGPLRSALALRHEAVPSLVWPDDRTWCVGVPIHTREIAVAASADVVDALVADLGLGARRASPDDLLDIAD
ncbi:hypothetical protein [Cellulomonas phragmiteti]|uniref:Uncharacterized protein n=1 Tax=Cellulomonas phragmiteti TaxID=478780 RepID=A0ABQ4DS99_9CELL|nr:hypothetical protein [Cellulomonas phragmiteti]GIG41872.1 hypothetical protein Cph01nite_36340 [Cellulomonas phragmiteti]